MRCRSLLTYLLVCVAGCTCEAEHRQLATTDAARLEADYSKELGCGAAGGHGFGLIFPTVEREYNQRLVVEAGPSAGTYEVDERFACRGESAELELGPGGARALVKCEEPGWDVYYLVPGDSAVHVLRGAFESRPKWGDVPSFDRAARRVMGNRFKATVARHVRLMHGDEALADVLADTVEISDLEWKKSFDSLPEPARTKPRKAVREALAHSEIPHRALGLVSILEASDRELVKSAIERYMRSPDPTELSGYRFGRARSALSHLASTGVDDLDELACRVVADQKCSDACLDVFSRSDGRCVHLERYLTTYACFGPVPCDRECDEAALRSRLEEALQRERTTIKAYLAALRRPELRDALIAQWQRRSYAVDREAIGCDGFGECACPMDDSVRRAACTSSGALGVLVEQTCRIEIVDEDRTLRLSAATPDDSEFTDPLESDASIDVGILPAVSDAENRD